MKCQICNTETNVTCSFCGLPTCLTDLDYCKGCGKPICGPCLGHSKSPMRDLCLKCHERAYYAYQKQVEEEKRRRGY